MLDAVYFDGRTTRARAVRIAVLGDQLVVAEAGAAVLRRPLAQVDVQPASRNAPQRIDLGQGAALEVSDKASLAAMLAQAGVRPGAIERAERSWLAVVIALVATVALAWFAYDRLLPWAANGVAQAVPVKLENRIGEQVWNALEQQMFGPSALPAARREKLTERFAQLVAAGGPAPHYRLEFRDGREAGPNAFALPGGIIVMTDALVNLATDDEGLLGVLAHELGHVEHRHTLRNLVHSAAIGTVVGLWFGDASALMATVTTTLATLAYSRDFERESDEYAIQRLRGAGVSTTALADLLEALQAHGKAASTQRERESSGLWSSHPLTADRVARLRAAAN